MKMTELNHSALQSVKGGSFSLAIAITAFTVGYILKEFTAGYWDADEIEY